MKKLLYKTLLICFILQLLLLGCVYFWAIKVDKPLFNDGECYSAHARIISLVLRDRNPGDNFLQEHPGFAFGMSEVLEAARKGKIVKMHSYEVGFITYLYAIIYAVFGYYPLLINLINILLHLMLGVVIFKIAKLVFNSEKVGYYASCLVLFNPTLFYYSTMKTTESIYLILTYSAIYFGLKLRENFSILSFVLLLLMVALLCLFKEYFAILLCIIYLLFFICLGISKFLNLLLQNRYTLLKAAYSIILILTLCLVMKNFAYLMTVLRTAAAYHYGYLVSGGHIYNLFIFGPDFSGYSYYQWFRYFLNAWYHMLFEPVGFYPSSLLVLYYPVKVLFLVFCLFATVGFIYFFKKRKSVNSLLLLMIVSLGSIVALSSGNIGTMLRHRDVITPIIFLYTSLCIADFSTITKEINLYCEKIAKWFRSKITDGYISKNACLKNG